MLPTLESDRLVLRPWRDEDAPFVLDLYSRPEVMRYLGRNPAVMTELSEARAKLADWMAFSGPLHGVWAIVPHDSPRPVGTVLLKLLPRTDQLPPTETEIGWHLHPDAWGRGYATEAGYRLLEHAWTNGLSTVLAVTYPENLVSQAVCRRLGMTWLGSTREYYDLTTELFSIDAPQ